jgi:hypothetical protein
LKAFGWRRTIETSGESKPAKSFAQRIVELCHGLQIE